MAGGFFPVISEQVDDPLFRELTVIEKAYYWLLVSEFNRFSFRKTLCLSDKWFAEALKVSEIKIRKARQEFKKNGWIKFKPGRLCGKMKYSTEYTEVRWAFPPEKGQGFHFHRMHRHAFNMLLNKALDDKQALLGKWRIGEMHASTGLTLLTVVVYIYLSYWRDTHSNGEEAFRNGDEFFISKRQLIDLSGIPTAPEAIQRLYDGFKFTGGAHLFEFKDRWTKFSFSEWSGFADPEDNEHAQISAVAFYKRIKTAQMAMKPIKKPTRKLHRDGKKAVHKRYGLGDMH